MVKQFIFLISLIPVLIFSGEFKARVNQSKIYQGESVNLTLTLKGVSSLEAPSIDALKTSFTIHSQKQSSSTIMMDGKISSSTSWTFTLLPTKVGEIIIPFFSINTSEGLLSTEPIVLRVLKGTPQTINDSPELSQMTLTSDFSNLHPYKNEPLFFTIKLISRQNLANIRVQKFTIEDAIFEQNGDTKVYETVVDNNPAVVIEFSYLITPLKAGPLNIPSVVVQGDVIVKNKSNVRSLFNEEFDPFSFMKEFNPLKPFALSTPEEILNVEASLGLNPWLPAKSLKIEEVMNEMQSFKEGEPFTRTFKIIAEGVKSNQLPSLSDAQVNTNKLKIYADKPEFGDEIKDSVIKSYRLESYTYIPQKAGELILPEISVNWWDVIKKEKGVAQILSKTLKVIPANEEVVDNSIALVEMEISQNQSDQLDQPFVEAQEKYVFFLGGGLVLLLFGVIGWFIGIKRKIKPVSDVPKKVHSKDKHKKLPDLNPT